MKMLLHVQALAAPIVVIALQRVAKAYVDATSGYATDARRCVNGAYALHGYTVNGCLFLGTRRCRGKYSRPASVSAVIVKAYAL